MGNIQKYADFTTEDAQEAKEELERLQGSGAYYKFKDGLNEVRIMPAPAAAGHKAIVIAHEHWVDAADGKRVKFACPRTHTKGRQSCPACSKYDKLMASGDPAAERRAKDFKPQIKCYANAIVRGEDEASGPKILQFGKMVYDQIIDIQRDEFTPKGLSITEIGPKGRDLYIKKRGKDLETKYTVSQSPEGPCPLSSDPEEAQRWLESMHDLSKECRVLSADDIEDLIMTGGASAKKPRGRSVADDAIDVKD